jgi:tetratricopeptide (TPR) repeat protein
MGRQERRREARQARQGGGSGSAALESALEHHRAGRLAHAEKCYRRILEAEPEEPTANHFLGLIAYQEGRYREALERITRSTVAAPGYAEAHHNLGNLHLDGKNHAQALDCYDRALTVNPEYASALANRGDALRGLGRLDEASAALRRAIQLDPFVKEPRYRLAATLLALGEADPALDATAGCLALEPYCQNAWAYRATALQALNKTTEFERFLKLSEVVWTARLAVPPAFAHLAAFNTALEEAVRLHPTLVWEPFQRVSYGGSVTGDLMIRPGRTLQLFEQSLRRAVDDLIARLPAEAGHPFLGRTPKRYRLTVVASILRAGGRHPTHTHEGAWLSGCYYVRMPAAVSAKDAGRAGWIEFGRPDLTVPGSFEPPVSAVAPEPGLAVFFPSYLFHGTIPFQGEDERVGIAFDVYPAD